MFRITRDPSSGSFIQCLAKIGLSSTHTHHGVSPILYFHYVCFLYMSCCFDLNPLAPELFFLILAHPVYKMQRLEVSGAVRPIYGSLGVKRLI